jgi:hypothetical protein
MKSEVGSYKFNLTPQLLIEVTVASLYTCMYVKCIDLVC